MGSPSWAISLGRKDRAAGENTCFASLALLAEFLAPYFLPHKLQHKLATLFDDTFRYFVCPCFQIQVSSFQIYYLVRMLKARKA